MTLNDFDGREDPSREPDAPWTPWAGRALLAASVLLGIAAVAFLLFGLAAIFAWTASIDAVHRFAPLYLSVPLALAAALAGWISWRLHFKPVRFAASVRRLWGQAEGDEPGAWTRLGRAYLEGSEDLARDEVSARFWLEKAARAGDQQANELLVILLREGRGGPRDPARARALEAQSAGRPGKAP